MNPFNPPAAVKQTIPDVKAGRTDTTAKRIAGCALPHLVTFANPLTLAYGKPDCKLLVT